MDSNYYYEISFQNTKPTAGAPQGPGVHLPACALTSHVAQGLNAEILCFLPCLSPSLSPPKDDSSAKQKAHGIAWVPTLV